MKFGIHSVLIICALLFTGCGLFVKKIPTGQIPEPTSYDHFVEINGVNYHYRDYPGEKESVMLLHGFASSTYTWERVAKTLNDQGYHVWALDMKGFGWSEKPKNTPYDAMTLMEEVNTWMEVMGLKNTVFVGNSLGGAIAVQLSVQHPDKIDRMVLIDAGGYPMKVPFVIKLAKMPFASATSSLVFGRWMVKKNVNEVMYNKDRVTDEQINAYYDRIRSGNGLYAQVETARAINFDRFEGFQESIKSNETETLIIWGENDEWIPLKLGYRYREDLKNSTLYIIPECGHIPQEEYPEETARVILDFIEGRPVKDSGVNG